MDLNKMKSPITAAQAMAHPAVFETVNSLGKMADELRAEVEALTKERDKLAGRVKALEPATHKTTGWVAPVDRYAVPVLFSPYTGEPRDVSDVLSDPQGVLIVPPGKVEMLAAKPTCKQPNQVESVTDCVLNLVDRLGHEADAVDARAWQHLLVYAPKQAQALEADAERYQLLSNYLISDDCQHDDAIVAARTVDQLNAALAVMKEPK